MNRSSLITILGIIAALIIYAIRSLPLFQKAQSHSEAISYSTAPKTDRPSSKSKRSPPQSRKQHFMALRSAADREATNLIKDFESVHATLLKELSPAESLSTAYHIPRYPDELVQELDDCYLKLFLDVQSAEEFRQAENSKKSFFDENSLGEDIETVVGISPGLQQTWVSVIHLPPSSAFEYSDQHLTITSGKNNSSWFFNEETRSEDWRYSHLKKKAPPPTK